jgi:diaminohydroxyphosphoribosylaminopyrimidine deaminase/5-amino-6-(5-phosphoribosylamino)uracil reductase
MTSQQHFEAAMRRALELALLGPAWGVNPQVGAVILDADLNIVAEGWHKGSGTPHAEVAALNDARDRGVDTRWLTAVVTLEPCNHTGKTGPCSQALIDAGIARVVYAAADPGKESADGAETLRAAGVETIFGVLNEQAEEQGRVWLTAVRQGRPFVTLKWATSLDGRAAAEDGSSRWVSGIESREDAHFRRSQVDAILVGTGTAMIDNPTLTARKPDGTLYEHQPLRVVIGETELPASLRVFDDSAPSVHLKTQSIHGALAELYERGVRHLMVEGGPKVASRFVKFDLVNEFITYLAPALIGGERTALKNIGVSTITESKRLVFKEVRPMGEDVFLRSALVEHTTPQKEGN